MLLMADCRFVWLFVSRVLAKPRRLCSAPFTARRLATFWMASLTVEIASPCRLVSPVRAPTPEAELLRSAALIVTAVALLEVIRHVDARARGAEQRDAVERLRGQRRQLARELAELVVVVGLIVAVLGGILVQRIELADAIEDRPGDLEGAVLRLQERRRVADVGLELRLAIRLGGEVHVDRNASRIVARVD